MSEPGSRLGEFLRGRRTAVFLIAWTLFVAAALWWLLQNGSASVFVVKNQQSGSANAVNRVQRWVKTEIGLARFYPWILFGPYVAYAALRYPLLRGELKRNLPANLATCAIFVYASHLVSSQRTVIGANIVFMDTIGPTNTFNRRVGPRHDGDVLLRFNDEIDAPPFAHLPKPWVWPLVVDLMAYCAIAGFAHSIYFYRQFRERERRALALESNLAQARLNTLKAQLQPHFLFNSLNASVALLRKDPAAAEQTLISLSELLRLALSYSERQEISIDEELEFVRRYVEIQRTRFGEKLSFIEDVADDTRQCLVPTLTLQPLIENAIRHGIEPSERNGQVQLKIARKGDCLALIVEDNGVGFRDGGGAGGTGIGLKNLRARLETLYGAAHKVKITSEPGEGTGVEIEIPCR